MFQPIMMSSVDLDFELLRKKDQYLTSMKFIQGLLKFLHLYNTKLNHIKSDNVINEMAEVVNLLTHYTRNMYLGTTRSKSHTSEFTLAVQAKLNIVEYNFIVQNLPLFFIKVISNFYPTTIFVCMYDGVGLPAYSI